ncbi:MAG: hypothetical protein AB7U82_27765 [Blastocatellales bacterium]
MQGSLFQIEPVRHRNCQDGSYYTAPPPMDFVDRVIDSALHHVARQ